MAKPKPPQRLRRRDAAEYLGVSLKFLEKLACYGGGPEMIKLSPKVVLYEVSALDAWVDAHRVGKAAA